MPVAIRPARATDIDALVAIENQSFTTDKLSRRSFRTLLERDTAVTLIAETEGGAVGYCMVLFRKGSGVARLYSIAALRLVDERGAGQQLLDAAEQAAYDRDRLLLRLEVREDNGRAIALYERNAYRRIGREPDYYEDGAPALRFEKILRGGRATTTTVPYFEQSVDFTCGPCCLMMALAHFQPGFVPDAVTEIRLWREATTIFMMSGPGGCEPFGMAAVAHERGLSAEIIVSHHGALFLQSVRSAEKRQVMELAQADFRRRVDDYGIPVDYRAFSLDDVRRAVAAGKLVVVLVSGYLMFGKKVPHWVLVLADDGDHLIVHDPWVEDERGEAKVDAAAIPVPHEVFYGMAQFGRMRAAIVLGEGSRQ
ncbi:MAG: GNAT family N-acetyltransferase/peptidase C39 family protein [Rhizobiaceae bacterium]|nr:GNAT family N-acetyltransferase/peptidase C39 family protein [Rhizobiaceae bacterium]